MEYIFPTIQHIAHLLPMDARITPPPEKMDITHPTTLGAPPSESSETVSETTQSSDGATAAGSPTKKRHRKPLSVSSSRSRTDVRHNSFQNTIFSPRPFESLYTERAYLASSLQRQSAIAADLIRQYSITEARHQDLEAGKERRRLRKYLGLLRSKINQAVEQEKAIFLRLGELYVEIQSRENWAWAHGPSFMDNSMPETPSAYSAMSPISCGVPTPTTPLDATSPEFFPGYFDDHHQPSDGQWCQQEPADPGRTLDTVTEEGEEPMHNLDVSHEYVDGEVSQQAEDAEDDSMPCFDASSRARRRSLPYIQTAWPET